jgi:retron-type reverse transcriptase
VLGAIYEEEFLGFSYGFRPKRSQHDALDALMVGISGTKVNFILDADIRSFFNEVSQEWLVRFVQHRIDDPRIVRLIQKWLKAGVLEDGEQVVSEKGTGQGSVISPLLANVYLHYVLISGPTAGDGARPRATWSWCDMLTILSSASNARPTHGASGKKCANGCGSSR